MRINLSFECFYLFTRIHDEDSLNAEGRQRTRHCSFVKQRFDAERENLPIYKVKNLMVNAKAHSNIFAEPSVFLSRVSSFQYVYTRTPPISIGASLIFI